jgi:hypothetical protein
MLYAIITEFVIYADVYNYTELDFLSDTIKKLLPDWEERLNSISDFDIDKKRIVHDFMTTENYISGLYQLTQDKLSLLAGKNTATWGNGVWGKKMLTFLKQFNITPICVIDSNAELHGTYTEDGIPIVGFDEAKYKCDAVIVAIKNQNIYEQIKKQIKEYNPKIEVKHYTDLYMAIN